MSFEHDRFQAYSQHILYILDISKEDSVHGTGLTPLLLDQHLHLQACPQVLGLELVLWPVQVWGWVLVLVLVLGLGLGLEPELALYRKVGKEED